MQQYSFVDKTPTYGINYYRLKQTDYDGTTEFSYLISVSSDNYISEIINQYPIPAHNSFFVNYNSDTDDMINLKILNISCKEWINNQYESNNGTNSINVDISLLTKGMYFLQLNKNEKTIYSKFIIDE